ncbi:Phage tail tube protein FII [Edwardsiella tarda]|nr:Phage tail tube protein FII [Edwardsiella tarda]
MVLGGVVREALLEYGGDMSHTALRFVGWLYDDEGGSQACEVEMRGRITEIDMGRQSRARQPRTPSVLRIRITSFHR